MRFYLPSLFLLLFILGTGSVYGQDTKVTTGVVNYNNEDYEAALENFNAALKYPNQLKAKNIPRAWLYKGKTLVQLYRVAAQNKDAVKLEQYENAVLDAYNCFVESKKTDKTEAYANELSREFTSHYQVMLQYGLFYLNQGNNKKALSYLDGSVAISEDYDILSKYIGYDLRGQAYLGDQDTLKAEADFSKCIKSYLTERPKNPDMLIAYAYYRLALIQRYAHNDLDAALTTIKEGKSILDAEHIRFAAVKNQFGEDQIATIEKQYNDASADLDAFELDIYLNSPDKYREALENFRKAVDENPENIIMRIAYASLLEKSDLDKAIEQYEIALQHQPDNGTALFNLGALYVNKAVEYSKMANNTIEDKEYEQYTSQTEENMKKALPYFRKAHELKPTDRQILKALMQITIQLGMDEEYKHYKELESDL